MTRHPYRRFVLACLGFLVASSAVTQQTEPLLPPEPDAPSVESAEEVETAEESEATTESPPPSPGEVTLEDAQAPDAGPEPEAEAAAVSATWQERIEKLSKAILLGNAQREDAEALLAELKPQRRAAREELRESLGGNALPEVLQADHGKMEDLYDARLLLLKEVRPMTRALLTGLGPAGVREAREELDRLQLHMRYQWGQVPHRLRRLGGELRTSPVPMLKGLVSLVFAIIIFRLWRRWAAETLTRMRQTLLAARPRTRRNIRAAKTLWYFDRLRTPLEWLVLLAIIVSVIRPADRLQEEDPIWMIVKWIFIGWMGLRLVDAMAARGGAGLGRDSTGLRMRSLKLLWGWIAAFGLSLDLADDYVGEGTIHSWVWRLMIFLGIPVVVLIVYWWREEIFRRLAKEPHLPRSMQRLAARSEKRQGLLAAAMAGVYLMLRSLQRWLLRIFSSFEVGRRLLAVAFRREVARQAESQRGVKRGEPLPAELGDRILSGGELVRKVHRNHVRDLAELVEEGLGRTAIIVGERGAGKSTLLSRLQEKLGDKMLLLDCPVGGFEALKAVFQEEFRLDPDSVEAADVRQVIDRRGIELVALDNAHRLGTPTIGGLENLDRVAEMIGGLGPEISWIVTADIAATQYVARARGERGILDRVIRLRSWTEEEIGELIATRTAAAEIEPDFEQLVLPRQLDEMVYEVEGDRKRAGFSRILWDSSDGNPAVALRLWCDSLAIDDRGRVVVQLFPQRDTLELEKLNLTARFVLRSIVQMEYAEPNVIVDALRLPAADIRAALRYALVRGYIEEYEGRFHIAWPWYRSVTRMLARQNLLVTE